MAQVVSPSTSSSSAEMIAIAVIVAFPVMSVLSAHKGAVKSLLSLAIAFCSSKYSTNTRTQEDKNADSACVICLGDISLGESRRVLTICGHGFHAHCIDSWLKINSICPLCRIPVPTNISMSCIENRLISLLISAADNIWNWILDPLSPEVIASLTNMECLS